MHAPAAAPRSIAAVGTPPLTPAPPRAPAAYGFALLKFQLSSEKKDFNLAPLVGSGMPAPVAHDAELPHSKRSSVYDAEAGDDPWPSKPAVPHPSRHSSSAYSTAMTNPGLGKRHAPAPQEAARPAGPLPVPMPGRYMASYYQPGAGLLGPMDSFPAMPAMPGRSEQDTAEMAATIEQIQALNAQLTDMVGGRGFRPHGGGSRYSEEAAAGPGDTATAAGAAAPAATRRFSQDGGQHSM